MFHHIPIAQNQFSFAQIEIISPFCLPANHPIRPESNHYRRSDQSHLDDLAALI